MQHAATRPCPDVNHADFRRRFLSLLSFKFRDFGSVTALSVLEAVVPTFHADLSRHFVELFPHVILALRSRFAIVRQSAARCFSTVCDVLTGDAMRYVIERVVPFLGDASVLANRQGAIELIYRKSFAIILLSKIPGH